jgi:hypothetical protein
MEDEDRKTFPGLLIWLRKKELPVGQNGFTYCGIIVAPGYENSGEDVIKNKRTGQESR